MGVACFQLEQIPDLSLNKYQSLADTGIEGVLKRHESFCANGMEYVQRVHQVFICFIHICPQNQSGSD